MPDKSNFLDNLAQSNFLDSIPCAVFLKDIHSKFIGCNNFLANLAGYPDGASMIGKTDYEMPWADKSINYAEIDQAVISGRRSIEKIEIIQLAKSQITARTIKTPFYLNGEIIGLIGTFVDVTDLITLAEAANYAKIAFLANMSHDIKTPLTGVIGMADILVHDDQARDVDRQRAEAIHNSGTQLLSFFNSCLELSKLEMAEWASEAKVFSCKSLLSHLHDLLIPAAQTKNLTLTTEFDPALPAAVRGYYASIYRILLNLAGNAIKFTQEGSINLRISLAEKIASDKIRINIEVTDTGIGIPAEKQSAIFEKLKRLTPSYEGKVEGSGIGLYIVDQYVKRMGGTIQVDSNIGKGSTFTISLPLTIADEIDLPKEKISISLAPLAHTTTKKTLSATESSLPDNSPRVLLVEDNPLIQHITQSLLTGAGFAVDIAGTGAEALAKFSPGKYNLVFMDIGLPDQNGYSVAHAMREKEKVPPTPIIALTAHGAEDVEQFCNRAGMQGVFSKPLTREQAESVWEHYGLGKSDEVNGLKILEPSNEAPSSQQIIDMEETIKLLGSEKQAKELLDLWFEMLTQRFLPALKELIEKQDITGLRSELHAMIGSLCYVKTPLLHKTVTELQTAARHHPQEIQAAYQHVLQESERFVEEYKKQRLL